MSAGHSDVRISHNSDVLEPWVLSPRDFQIGVPLTTGSTRSFATKLSFSLLIPYTHILHSPSRFLGPSFPCLIANEDATVTRIAYVMWLPFRIYNVEKSWHLKDTLFHSPSHKVHQYAL